MGTKAKKIKRIADYRMLRYKLNLNQTEFWGRIGSTQTAGCRYEKKRGEPGAVEVPNATAVLAHLVYIMGQDIDVRDYK